MVSLQQTFPSRQKRDPRARLAEDDAGVAAIELETLRQEVSAEVRKLCVDLMRNADEMRLQARQSSLLKEALAAALAQYTTGKAPQADVLRAQMALTRLSEQLIELEEERDNARAQLNALMGRPADEAIEIAGSYAASRRAAFHRGAGAQRPSSIVRSWRLCARRLQSPEMKAS